MSPAHRPEEEEEVGGPAPAVGDTRTERRNRPGGEAFLDAFYGLSASDPIERAQAASTIVQTGLVGHPQDAAYAWRRLLNGVCSHRLAARQGNAAALTSFLKYAWQLNKISDLRQQETSSSSSSTSEISKVSDLAYIRDRIMAATTLEVVGKTNGLEERDHQFGRLFGLLAVIRSGILLTVQDDADHPATTQLLAADLLDLYGTKKWMREPASHALSLLLQAFYTHPDPAVARRAHSIVQDVIIPQLFQTTPGPKAGHSSRLEAYSAEQLALLVLLQQQQQHGRNALPEPLHRPVLAVNAMPLIAPALRDTSTVAYPQRHMIWGLILYALTKPIQKQSTETAISMRKLKGSKTPLTQDKAVAVLEALVQNVILGQLLGVDQTDGGGGEAAKSKATHDRRALALSLVHVLVGGAPVTMMDTMAKIQLEPAQMEQVVLNPLLVRKLFLDVLCTGGSGASGRHASHTLKPLALQVLESMVEVALATDQSSTGTAAQGRSVALTRAFLRCDPRFDSRTKTKTVEHLLDLEHFPRDAQHLAIMGEYISFLEMRVAKAVPPGKEGGDDKTVSTYEAIGYVDLLYSLAKGCIGSGSDTETNLDRERVIERVTETFMAWAFFDCSDLKDDALPTLDTTRIKPKPLLPRTAVPFPVRTVVSSRFFSLVADRVTHFAHAARADRHSKIHEQFSSLHQFSVALEEAGAQRLSSLPPEETTAVVTELNQLSQQRQPESEDEHDLHRSRCTSGMALLAAALYLHFLRCGRPEVPFDDDDEPDADDEDDDAEEIVNAIIDCKVVGTDLLAEDSNKVDALNELAQLCVNVLSSPLCDGSQSRGASPRLLREIVKMAWIGGLGWSSRCGDLEFIDPGTVNDLLRAVGAPLDEEDQMDEEEEDDEEIDDDEDDNGGAEESAPKASRNSNAHSREAFDEDAEQEGNDEDEDDEEENEDQFSDKHSGDGTEDSEDEIELDPAGLRSLLEEDTDDDVESTEVEHHAGADAALAKLIQLKQELRKAGQTARERIEISRRSRCFLLLETLLMGKPEGWGKLLAVDSILRLLAPLLSYRFELEKSINRAVKGSDSALSEKRNVLEKVTSLLRGRILKMKLTAYRWSSSVEVVAYCAETAETLLEMAQLSGSSKEHQLLCSQSVLFVVRSLQDADHMIKVAEVVAKAVSQWATKRTARLDCQFFDSFIQQHPGLAQVSLVGALTTAASAGRTAYLKSETFRMIHRLYSVQSDKPNLVDQSRSRLLGSAGSVLEAVANSLKDPGMKKSKRAKEVLKTAQAVVSYVKNQNATQRIQSGCLVLRELLATLTESSDSPSLRSACEKLDQSLEEIKPKRALKEEEAGDHEVPPTSTHQKKRPKKEKK